MRKTAEYWIKYLDLEPHPEGGFFCEIYRSEESVQKSALPERYTGDRDFGTSIYFLLRSQDVSHFHRLQSDEIWHFYAGSSLTIHLLNSDDEYTTQSLGAVPEKSEQLQFVVPKGVWFGATVNEPDSYSLVGCTMAPGFNFVDFELGEREELIQQFPQHRGIIERLT